MSDYKEQIVLEDDLAARIFGPADHYLRLITANLLTLLGSRESVAVARALFDYLITLARERELEEGDVHYALTTAAREMAAGEVEGLNQVLLITPRGKQIRPKTKGQKEYLDMIRKKPLPSGLDRQGPGKPIWRW